MLVERPEQDLSLALFVIEGGLFGWLGSRLRDFEFSGAISPVNANRAGTVQQREVDYKLMVEGVKGCAILAAAILDVARARRVKSA